MVVLRTLLWFIFIPVILGKSITKKDKNKILYSWVLGNILQMAVFFIIALPMILKKVSFFFMWKVYIVAIILLSIISLIVFRKKIFVKPQFEKIDFWQVIAILVILIQLFVKVKYTNVNNDDASYIASAATIQYTGYMYYTEQYPELEARKALAPISAYYAAVSEIIGVEVAIVAHSIVPLSIISMSYLIYYYLGRKIFENKSSVYIMLILLSVLNLYAFSTKGINKYLILYSWFGRSILAGVCMPLIWEISLDAMNKESNHLLDWIGLFVTSLASCMCSEMAVPLIGISLGGLAFVSMIRDKKISYAFKTILPILPCAIVGVIYIFIK